MPPYALPGEIWTSGLVFLRVAAIVMLLPGLSDATVPPRVRLSFALLLSLCIIPLAASTLPPLPPTMGAAVGIAIKELIIGLMIGALLRILLASLAVAGEVTALQTTLGFAQTANPSQAQPSVALSAFLTVMGVTLVFASGLHRSFLTAIANSYVLFAPTKTVLIQDAGQLAIRTVSQAFALGVQLAAPVIVFSLVFNIATGLVGRVMPQFQVFFVAAPLNILLGLSIFALSLGVLGLVWLNRYQAFVGLFT
ncbi:MAG TPA: flagellar biosynthetic protein FliR [Caulobacteraceae bacterium]